MFAGNKKIYHLLFLIVVIGLTLFKWHDFYLPYFWDELGVYSRAVDYQFHHRLSLMPGSLPPLLSRGHPLLFAFLNASAMRVFGEHIFTAHLFCFLISVLLLLVVYLKISRYFGYVSGIMAVILLTVQPLFLAQSGLVLPEILLTLFIFLALCSYYENAFVLFAVYASLAALTKEAGIILPATIMAHGLLKWILNDKKPVLFKPAALVTVLIPYAVFALFLWVQKQQNGWYFFPLHIDSVSFSFDTCLRQLKAFVYFIFWMQGRFLCSVLMVLAGVVAAVSGNLRANRVMKSFLWLLAISAVSFSLLGALVDLYLDRYLMPLLLFYCVFAAVAFTSVSARRFFMVPVILLVAVSAFQNAGAAQFNYDADLGYRSAVKSLQSGVSYMEEIMKPEDKMYANFPGYFALTFPPGGYLKGEKIDSSQIDNRQNFYLLYACPGAGINVDTAKYSMQLLKRFEDHFAYSEVYRVKRR